MSRYAWLFLAPVLAVAACGTEDATVANVTDAPAPDPETIYTGTGTVMETAETGPQLCLGGVAESYPPQCGGPDISNWSWDEVDPDTYESASGSTWGVYVVTGRYDGETFELTEPASSAMYTTPPPVDHQEPDFSSPCEPPAGGWAVVDPEKTNDDALQEALQLAAEQPDYAGAWVDQSINPASEAESDLEAEEAMNDPSLLVLNVQFTGDLERHEAELREVWGGALCVSEAEHTEAELRAIQDELVDIPGFLGAGVDTSGGVVTLQVEIDDGLQQRLDEQYGEGIVRVTAALTPVDP
ncbi:hypothetical protein G1H11_09165 [Phytoactinopolyspora alkaliphila]|uniref:Uncharacterized protein n=1 Tax=Phytoactinopolyspora alkaliphila TaxID=1783498 RepID=A0A6N9YKJ8_9ACTN|nr:hypothetical protein [Phytoactinopolyspora alkaliphila]NED95482.1 hypothetical protein [Phytoactinopolyspora alkaliphila]